MEEKIELLFNLPKEVIEVEDRMMRELPIREEVIRSPMTNLETRELKLTNGKKIRASVDPYIIIPKEIY